MALFSFMLPFSVGVPMISLNLPALKSSIVPIWNIKRLLIAPYSVDGKGGNTVSTQVSSPPLKGSARSKKQSIQMALSL